VRPPSTRTDPAQYASPSELPTGEQGREHLGCGRRDPNARALPRKGYEVSVVVVVVVFFFFTWGEEEGALGAIVSSPADDFAAFVDVLCTRECPA
jgi:hypothetical protein